MRQCMWMLLLQSLAWHMSQHQNLNKWERISKRTKWLCSLIRYSWSFGHSYGLFFPSALSEIPGSAFRKTLMEETFSPQGIWLQDQAKLLLSVRASSRWQKNASWTPRAAGISIRQLYLACLPWQCRHLCQVTSLPHLLPLLWFWLSTNVEQHCRPQCITGIAFCISRGLFWILCPQSEISLQARVLT